MNIQQMTLEEMQMEQTCLDKDIYLQHQQIQIHILALIG